MAEKYGCRYTTDVTEVARSEAEAVSVATPDFAHFEVVNHLIEAGKHVLVEKPLTTDVAEAEQLVAAAEARSVRLMVNFANRWNPRYLVMKEAIIANRLGRPVMGYARLSNPGRVPRDMLAWSARSGPEWFLLPHVVDVVCWLLQEQPRRVFASAASRVHRAEGRDIYDAMQAQVMFDQAFVTFETCWILPETMPAVASGFIELIGENGWIRAENGYQGVEIADPKEYVHPGTVPLARPNLYGKVVGHYFDSIRHFVDCVADGTEPSVSGRDGLLVTRVIAAMRTSVERGQPVAIRSVLPE